MSRSGYTDDYDQWAMIRWRGAVKSGLKGKRGQAFLHEIIDALDALPEKKLTTHALESEGSYCTLGAVGARRGMDMSKIDPEDYYAYPSAFGISNALAREIVYMNDEGTWGRETPEERWQRMRDWAEARLLKEKQE